MVNLEAFACRYHNQRLLDVSVTVLRDGEPEVKIVWPTVDHDTGVCDEAVAGVTAQATYQIEDMHDLGEPTEFDNSPGLLVFHEWCW